jgi:DNA-binding NarL/FixJ family response regulator
MFKIGIADDHEIVRNGLRMIIEQHHMQNPISASSFDELLRALKVVPIDLLILDLNLGDTSGLDSLKKLKAQYPSLPILVLSAYPEDIYAVRAYKAGAMGYLNKTVISEELITAIETIQKGKRYISNTLQETLPYGLSLEDEKQNLIEKLSKRELEVLTLLSESLSFQEIAQKLAVSPKTISTYRTRMLEKLHLENTSQLLQFAYEIRQTI